MLKNRLAQLAKANNALGSTIHQHSETRIARELSIASSSVITTKTTALPIPPRPIKFKPHGDATQGTESAEETPKKTQRAEVLEDFENAMPQLFDLMFEHQFNPFAEDACLSCTRPGARRTTRCYDCNHPLSCSECFIDAHCHNRTHWAEVWNQERGFFVRHDISALRDGGYAQHLGHGGQPCPMPDSKEDLNFCIIDVNGIHNTKIRFCHCPGSGDRVVQLMQHRLFPGTLHRPVCAFTFQLLHHFHLHHLESKATKYDYMGALRRLTDNVFTNEVSDFYSRFRIVTQVWVKLTATKRLGQAHSIDEVLPHRPKENLIVYCPACPEPHVNMLPGWEDTPAEFRHLKQLQITLDGNFHLNRYMKNTDPEDLSLFHGHAYFPNDLIYQNYVRNVVYNSKTDHKIKCGHLEVLKKQDATKKFKNMAVSGIVNAQCSHVFIKSSIDLQVGERFPNVDFCVAKALRQQQVITSYDIDSSLMSDGSITDRVRKAILDLVLSYDVNCEYCIHVVERFLKAADISDVAEAVTIARWLIPIAHVQNHNDDCIYMFSSAYTLSTGHFHGETAEHFWPTGNQLGGQTRQMNAGHRHDTLIDHFGDWNFKKMVNIPHALYNDVMNAKKLFDIKFSIFKDLSSQYANHVHQWNQLDRAWHSKDGQVVSVYRHNQRKVPSQSRIYQMLISGLSTNGRTPTIDGPSPPTASEVHFVHNGLLIRASQLALKAKVLFSQLDDSKTMQEEIETLRQKLRSRIEKWRSVQKHLMPLVGDHVASQSDATSKPEEEKLFLPSDFTTEERESSVPLVLTECERKLLEGRAFDLLRDLRTVVKTLTNLGHEKTQNYGQARQTRVSARIQEVSCLCDTNITEYNATRNSLIRLGVIDSNDPLLRHLTKQDTYRKRTTIKRAVGDTYRHDGLLWANRGVASGTQRAHLSASTGTCELSIAESSSVGTQVLKAKKRQHIAGRKKPKKKKRRTDKGPVSGGEESDAPKEKATREDGWLWKIRPTTRLSEKELQDWLEEGDRVQWFRAEAEMQRWKEEWEIKQVEFLRCIRSYEKMSAVWSELAIRNTRGKSAYAKKKSSMFSELATNARNLFKHAGYGDLLGFDGRQLVKHFQDTRDHSDYIVPELQPGFVPEVITTSEESSEED